MSVFSTDAVLLALGQCQLVGPAELIALARQFSDGIADPRPLGDELVRRGWLTGFQVEHLLRGEGAGLVLDRYVLLECLGEGAMGQVFKARQRLVNRHVAIKVIHRRYLERPKIADRFRREIRAVAHLNHPNVVRAFDAGEYDGHDYLVMEYIDGTDLHRLIQQGGPLSAAQACDCIRQAALGLQHAHELGLVHRDIKPANLLWLPAESLVKVADLGLALLTESAEYNGTLARITGDGVVIGTVDFMAPEQCDDAHAVDIRADLYSLGCSLYYLLTGRVPFPGGNMLQKINRHRQEQPAAVEQFRPDLPEDITSIVYRLMAKDPAARFQTPAELADALTPAVAPVAEPLVDATLFPSIPDGVAHEPVPFEVGTPPPGMADVPLALLAAENEPLEVVPVIAAVLGAVPATDPSPGRGFPNWTLGSGSAAEFSSPLVEVSEVWGATQQTIEQAQKLRLRALLATILCLVLLAILAGLLPVSSLLSILVGMLLCVIALAILGVFLSLSFLVWHWLLQFFTRR